MDVGGIPVVAATMRIREHLDFLPRDGEPTNASATADLAGRFEFRDLPPGDYALDVWAPGFANLQLLILDVPDHSRDERVLVLLPAGKLSGRVQADDGTPVAEAAVLAMSYTNSARCCREQTLTDDHGEFALERLARGMYTLAFRAPGFRPGHASRVATGTSDLLITLQRAALIEGRVIAAEEGDQLAHYSVRLRTWYPRGPTTSASGPEWILDDPRGRFSIHSQGPGSYVVQAIAPGHAPSFSEPFEIRGATPALGIDVHLTVGGALRATAVCSAGRPAADLRMSTHGNDWQGDIFDRALGDAYPTSATLALAQADAAGRLELLHLRPGIYQVRIRAAGHRELVLRDIVVREGETTDLGRLRLNHGQPVSGSISHQIEPGSTVSEP